MKHLRTILLALFIFSVVGSAVASGDPSTFTIVATSGSNGTMTPNGLVVVDSGLSQAFSIMPNTGYHIDSVIVDGANAGQVASYTFTNVTADHTIRIAYAIDRFVIKATAAQFGTIAPSGNVVVDYGTNRTFTVTPNVGNHADSLIVDGVNQGALTSYTFNAVTANHTIRAVFAVNFYTLNSTSGPNGTVNPLGTQVVAYGSSRAYSMTPATGYHVDSVFVDGIDQGRISSYTFVGVSKNHTLRAVFAINRYTIVSSSGPNGTISPSGSVVVSYGANQTYAFTSSVGYHADSVIVDGVNQGQAVSYTFTSVAANHTIRIVHALNHYTISASAGSNGSLTPAGSVDVVHGSSKTFTVAPNAGYHIDSVLVDGLDAGQVTTYSFANVTGNHTIRTVYASNQHTITATAGQNGSLTPVGTVAVNHGSDQSFTVTSYTGYHVDSVLVDGANVGAVGSYTFSNVTANHTIRSVFALDQFTITATTGPNGAISPNGVAVVNYGSTQAYTITPNPGYHVDSVLVDGANAGAVGAYTFTNVIASHTIRSVFAIDQFTITATTGPNGAISPNGVAVVNFGSAQGYTITPNSGYHVDSVLVDGANVGAVGAYTFTVVTASHTIRSVFAIDQFTIAATSGPHGSIAPPGTTTVPLGGSQSYTMTPSAGYHVADVTIDGSSAGNLSSYLFSDVRANHTIAVLFSVDTMTITATAGPGGSISPSGSVAVPCGTNKVFAIVPDASFSIDSVFVDGSYVGAGTSYNFTNVTANHSIRARFGGGSCYRSFVYDSMHVRKGVRKKPVTSLWEFRIVNTLKSAVNEVTVHFNNDVKEFLSSGTSVPTGTRKDWVFTGRIAPNETLAICGRSAAVSDNQMITRYWLGPMTGKPVHDVAPSSRRLEVPMPNFANVRDELFACGAFFSTKGLVVGVPRSDSAHRYGWARIPMSFDMFRSIQDNTGYHHGEPRGFDKIDPTHRAFVGERKRVPPQRHNNRLFADLLALKFNIALSAMRITPPGFGELRYLEPGSPYNNLLVREIAGKADSAMTFWKTNSSSYATLDETIARINASFSGAIDTTSWCTSLRLTGARELSAVTFLAQSGEAPSLIATVASPVETELPAATALLQNYPNPFNPATTIEFELAASSIVTLKVYNVLGEEVATLINGQRFDDGVQQAEFDASQLASGIYFYRLSVSAVDDDGSAVEQFTQVRKMMLVK